MSDAFEPPNDWRNSHMNADDHSGVRSLASLATPLRVLLMIWLGASAFILLTEIALFTIGNTAAGDLMLVFSLPVIVIQILVYLTCAKAPR
ncbi:MAG: hypothetical protein ACI9MC_003142 [Kiritimatiellia bacterium]|jgi:hypothetical protein